MLFQHTGPICIGFFYVARNVFHPFFLYFTVVIQIKFTIDYFPAVYRVDICGGPHRNGISSVSAVLRRIFFGIRHK